MVTGEVTLYKKWHLNSSLSRLQYRIWGKTLRYGSSRLFWWLIMERYYYKYYKARIDRCPPRTSFESDTFYILDNLGLLKQSLIISLKKPVISGKQKDSSILYIIKWFYNSSRKYIQLQQHKACAICALEYEDHVAFRSSGFQHDRKNII